MNKNQKPSAPKDEQRATKKIIILFITIFICLTAAYIFNESQTPIYTATATIRLEFKDTQKQSLPKYNDFYQYQTRLQKHINQMQASEVLKDLQDNTVITKILDIETTQKQPVPMTPLERIQSSLNIQLDVQTQNILISSTDQNAKLATTIANLLPKVYQQHLQKIPADLTKEITSIKDQSAADVLPNTYSPPLKLKDIRAKQAKLYSQIQEVQYILSTPYKYVPKFIEDKTLIDLHYHLVQKELSLQRLKSQTTNLKALLTEIGFLDAKFSQRLRNLQKDYYTELAATRKQEANLLGTNDNQKQTQVYKNILSQKSLEPFLTSTNIIVVKGASHPVLPTKPNKAFNLFIAAVLGLLLGLVLAKIFGNSKNQIHRKGDANVNLIKKSSLNHG